MLVLIKVKVASADALVAQNAIGRGELGHDQPASPEVLDEAAKDGVGDSGHGGQDGGGRDADVAYRERCGKESGRDKWVEGQLAGPAWDCFRVVSKLLHRMILLSFPVGNRRKFRGTRKAGASSAWHARGTSPVQKVKPAAVAGFDSLDFAQKQLFLGCVGLCGFGFAGIALGVLAAEAFYAASGVHELLLAGEKGVASRA